MRIHSAGSVQYLAPATPTFVWQSGAFASIASGGAAGEVVLTYDGEQQIAPADCVVLFTKRGQPAVGQLPGLGIQAQTVAALTVESMQEVVGAPSVATDLDFDFVIVDLTHNEDAGGVGLVACVSASFAAGPIMSLLNNSGQFSQITRSAQGIYLVDMQADQGFDPTEISVIATPRVAAYPATMLGCAVEWITDTQIEIRILEDNGAAGSIAQDARVDLIFVGLYAQRPPQFGYPDPRNVRLGAAAIGDVTAGNGLKVNGGQLVEMLHPNAGEYNFELEAGFGIQGPNGLFVGSVADRQAAGLLRNVMIDRPGTPVFASNYQAAEAAGFPAAPADFDSALVGVQLFR